MKKRTKVFLTSFALFALVSCTKSFCTNADKANIISAYSLKEAEENKTNEEKLIENLKNSGLVGPSDIYFEYLDTKVYDFAINSSSINYAKFESGGNKQLKEYTIDQLKQAVGKDDVHKEAVAFNQTSYYACIKFAGDEKDVNVSATLWYNFDKWTKEIEESAYKGTALTVNGKNYQFTLDDLPSKAFLTSYKNNLSSQTNNVTTCITPRKGVYDTTILEGKSWGRAFKFGLIEGLIEYPIAWMLDGFYSMFNLGAIGAILSILFVTIIVRLFLLLVTFKSTISQTKMQELAPQLSALQEKYPNANTNEYEKRQMAEEQMKLYKDNKVNPLSMILVMIIQFPIFIAVWGAMSGSAVLRLDTLFAGGGRLFSLQLSSLTSNAILSGNLTAIILFIIMSLVQILSVKLPMFLQKRDAKKYTVSKGKNPTKDQNNKQANMMSNVMMVMIIVMGFTLPVAMALYWIISALISLAQSLIIRAVSNKKNKSKKFVKYR